MARAMWRGAIQFGLVTVPVKLYLATESRGGYEYSKGQYVVVDESDFESVPLKTVRAIEIETFVDANADDNGTRFVKQAYYLEPEAIGRKAFYLLKSVLAEEGLSAICKIVLKDREALAALNPYSNTMLLTTIYWPDEVRSTAELDLPADEFEFKPAEKAMATQLAQAMKGDFRAEDYRDDYRQALMAVIEAKIAGQPAEQVTVAEKPTRIADLMSVLEASVAAARESRARQAEAAESAAEVTAEAKPATRRARRTASSKAEPKAEPKQERRRKVA
jgi:DNA end-binding protein Ku